jgi:hypothetical protein
MERPERWCPKILVPQDHVGMVMFSKIGSDRHFRMSLTSDECRRLLSLYDSALTSRIDGHRSKNAAKDLLELDAWRLKELSKAVRERKPSYMTKEELEKLMDCKLYIHSIYFTYVRSRGKFRPRLKSLISSNNAADVKSSTEKAFAEVEASIPSSVVAIKTLSELKGVGPATATMILQAKSDDIPFMSDEAMLQVFDGDKTKLKYDMKTCRIFLEQVDDIVTSLGKGRPSLAKIDRRVLSSRG